MKKLFNLLDILCYLIVIWQCVENIINQHTTLSLNPILFLVIILYIFIRYLIR